jgi:hypothetical protein
MHHKLGTGKRNAIAHRSGRRLALLVGVQAGRRAEGAVKTERPDPLSTRVLTLEKLATRVLFLRSDLHFPVRLPVFPVPSFLQVLTRGDGSPSANP